ncbi:MAG: hypothetical protein ACI9VM_000738 [Candidatus Azotimanducaceae bacterium]|jgi:hypothetical protein
MKILLIVVVMLGIGIAVSVQQGVFERSTPAPVLQNNSDYVPSEVVNIPPPPFAVLAPGASKIEIYDGIKFDLKTATVDLSGRGLSGSLKAEVNKLTSLKVLNLSGNTFTGLPAEVGQLTQLEVLNLSNNQLTGIPQELGNLQNLKELDLRGNDISESDLELISERLSSSTIVMVEEGSEVETEEES